MRGAGGAGVLAPGEPHPFPPVRFPAPPTWRWHIQAPVPAHRVTLAESLLHCGPQFPHLYRGGGGCWRNLESLEQPRSGRTPPKLLPGAARGLRPSSPNPRAPRGRGQQGLTGGTRRRGLRTPAGSGKSGLGACRVDQHGRPWGSRTACAGLASPLPRAGRRRRAVAGRARHAGRGTFRPRGPPSEAPLGNRGSS